MCWRLFSILEKQWTKQTKLIAFVELNILVCGGEGQAINKE